MSALIDLTPEWASRAYYDGRVDRADDGLGPDPLPGDEENPPVSVVVVPLLPTEEDGDADASLGPDVLGAVVMRGYRVSCESERRGELAESLRALGSGPKPRSTVGRYLVEAAGHYRAVLLLGTRPTEPVLEAARKHLVKADYLRRACMALGLAESDAVTLLRAEALAHAWYDRVYRTINPEGV